jgi:hypothetical protein
LYDKGLKRINGDGLLWCETTSHQIKDPNLAPCLVRFGNGGSCCVPAQVISVADHVDGDWIKHNREDVGISESLGERPTRSRRSRRPEVPSTPPQDWGLIELAGSEAHFHREGLILTLTDVPHTLSECGKA